MYLPDKETYQIMMGEFDAHLEKAHTPLTYRQRDRMLAKLLFDKTPNEIHQRLSRGYSVPVDWTAGDPNVLSIWHRTKLIMDATGLTEDQLKSMVSDMLAKTFHRLELSMQSVVFQSLLGMKVLPLESDLPAYSSKSGGKFLRQHAFSILNSPYMQPAFDSFCYQPSSKGKVIICPFDNDTHEIISRAFTKAISIAESKAILSDSEVLLLANDLSALRDYHLAALVLQPTERLINNLQDYLINYVKHNFDTYDTPPHE